MSTLQARHRGHNIPDGVTTFNEIEYDREGGVFLNRTKLILLAIIVFLLTAFSAFIGRYTAERQFRQKADYSGVPDNQIPFLAVEPESYKVFLDPKLYAADGTVQKHDVDYSGRVEVIFRPKTDTSVISLHVGSLLKMDGEPMLKRRLSMDTPTDQVLQDDTKYELNAEVDAEQETLTVSVGEPLKSGHYYSLFVNFTGAIGRNPEGGFFKVVFDNKETVKSYWYVATKLAPRKARNLLPCVDNPKHKAIFEMSVVRSKDTKVIFNTKVRATEPFNGDLLVDHFEKTGMIRPDSLGLFMSNFKSNLIPTDDSVELTVWSPESTDSTEMIIDVVPKTLDFMKTYLATNFPTSKLDIVVVPSEAAGSTESPGLIVIKDSVLGTLDQLSITDYQKSVGTLTAHVIRQWLMPLRGLDRGNNEDRWLNEAIVNFLKIINIDNIKPAWELGQKFPLDTVNHVMFYDSWTNSEQLANYDHHTEIYDYISSGKGTAILRMLNETFTEDIFKQTLREYVHTEIYKYKDTISFWTLLDDNARNKSIKLPESSAVMQILNTWIQNKNFPLVKLEVDGDDLILKQFRFEYNDPKLTNDWVIPVTLTSGAAYSTTVWLENNPETRVTGYVKASNGTWIMANQHRTGYYRVAYEDTLLDRISYEIVHTNTFDRITVAQLIEDIFEGALAGIVSFSDALGLLQRVTQFAEPYATVWDSIFDAFSKMEGMLHSTKHYDDLSAFMEMVVDKAYTMFVSTTIDSPDKTIGMMDTLSFAGRMELKKCVLRAQEQFDEWTKTTTDVNPIVPNDRKSVYCTAMQYATKHDLRFMLDKYASSKWTPDRKTIAKSFSCSRNTHFLHKIFSANGIRSEDLTDVWESVLEDPVAGPHAFYYIRNNWETLYEDYSSTNVELLCTMLHAAVRGLNSLSDLEVLQTFYEKYFGNAVENKKPTLAEVLRFEEEILRQKIAWREKYETVISVWMAPKAAKLKTHHYVKPVAEPEHVDEKTRVPKDVVEIKPAPVLDETVVEIKPAPPLAETAEIKPAVADEAKQNVIPAPADEVKQNVIPAPTDEAKQNVIPAPTDEAKGSKPAETTTTPTGDASPSTPETAGENVPAVTDAVPNTEQRALDVPAASDGSAPDAAADKTEKAAESSDNTEQQRV